MTFNTDPQWLKKMAAAEDNQIVNIGLAPFLYVRKLPDTGPNGWYLTTQREPAPKLPGTRYFRAGAPALVTGLRNTDQEATWFRSAVAACAAGRAAGYEVRD